MSKNDLSDHDLLTKLSVDMDWLVKIVGNHLKHHWIITVTAFSAALSAITALILIIVKLKG